MTQIRDALLDFNPWWKGETRIEFRERDVYREVQKYIPMRQILAFTGLRRTGKTTLMLKLAEDAIASGLEPRRVLYFSFDEFRETGIRETIREFEELMQHDLGSGKYLVLLDELQKLDGWEDQVKALYDRLGRNVKMIISGSESLFIRRKSRETLAGRLFEFKLEPLTFREYLLFRGIKFEPIGLYEKELARAFTAFTRTMGFPELVDTDDRAVVRKYVRESIVEKILYRDLPGIFGLRNVAVLESLLNILMEEPGQLLDLSTLAGELNVSRQTVSTYLSHLEDSFLLRKLYNFSTGRRKVERKLKKYYPTLASVDLVFRDDDLSRSRALEWLVVNQLRAEFFWRDPYKNEVDIVLTNKKPLPVEVKHGKIELDGVRAFMNRYKVDLGFVVSADGEETRKIDGGTVKIVPAYKLLASPDRALGLQRR